MNWFVNNFEKITDLTWMHVWLSVIPILAGFAISLPLGWLAYKQLRLRGWILGAGSVVYAIPSLPLFVILPSIIGTGFLDPMNVVIALTLYAIALLVRSVVDGFASVPHSVLAAAEATGYSQRQLIFKVHLPLAGPVILAGLRVVAVSTVSLVSVGAIIGVNSLGSLFTDGFQRGFATPILIGMMGTIMLAFIADVMLTISGRLLMPWTVR